MADSLTFFSVQMELKKKSLWIVWSLEFEEK